MIHASLPRVSSKSLATRAPGALLCAVLAALAIAGCGDKSDATASAKAEASSSAKAKASTAPAATTAAPTATTTASAKSGDDSGW
jgi:hypothetical protein